MAWLALVPALVLLAACSSSGSTDGSSGAKDRMQAEVATTDLYVNAPQRVAVGLIFADGRLVSFGSVGFRFSYLGSAEQPIAPQAGPQATAAYIPTPGTPLGSGSSPTITDPSKARGVYQAEGVTFDSPGFWQVEVTADIERALSAEDLIIAAPSVGVIELRERIGARLRGDQRVLSVTKGLAESGERMSELWMIRPKFLAPT